jgi:hypothetical protein
MAENTRYSRNWLDLESDISTMQDVDTAWRACLSTLMMGDMVDCQPKLAGFEIVISTVRELQAALGSKFGKAEPQESETVTGFTRGLRSGLHTTLVTLEYLASVMGGASEPSQQNLPGQNPEAVSKSAETVEAEKRAETVEPQKKTVKYPVFYECSQCQCYHQWRVPWTPGDCKPTSEKRFTAEELVELFPNGWIRRPQPNDGRGRFDPNDVHWQNHDHANLEHKLPVLSELDRLSPEVLRPTGMREGSNADRIWQATRCMLLERGTMHIDDIIASIEALGLFGESVKDRRIRTSNLLSQYKAKGLMTSDNRGHWSLLNGKASG